MENDETRWCHNAKTGDIFNYRQSGSLTDFPRGTLMAYGDYLTTGLKSKKEAEEWANKYAACPSCRGSSPGQAGDKCFRCQTILEAPKQ